MGPDPVPELHRGVQLIIRSVARMAGRQHSKKHSHNTVLLNENRDPWEKVPCHSGSYSSQCYSQIPISRQYWGICATPFENFRRSNDSKWCQRSKSVNSIQSIDEIRVARISRFPAWFREMWNGEKRKSTYLWLTCEQRYRDVIKWGVWCFRLYSRWWSTISDNHKELFSSR